MPARERCDDVSMSTMLTNIALTIRAAAHRCNQKAMSERKVIRSGSRLSQYIAQTNSIVPRAKNQRDMWLSTIYLGKVLNSIKSMPLNSMLKVHAMLMGTEKRFQ